MSNKGTLTIVITLNIDCFVRVIRETECATRQWPLTKNACFGNSYGLA